MNAVKKFTDYLPTEQKPEIYLFQVKIDKNLWTQANAARDADGLTWRVIAEAALKSYLDSRKK